MNAYFTKFQEQAQALATVSFDIAELIAQKKHAQNVLFETFKGAIVEALKTGNTEEVNKILTEGLASLDEQTGKTLRKAEGYRTDGSKKRVVWLFSQNAIRKSCLKNLDAVAFAESLENPFIERDKEEKPEKSEEEKFLADLRRVAKRLEDKKVIIEDKLFTEKLNDVIADITKRIQETENLGA